MKAKWIGVLGILVPTIATAASAVDISVWMSRRDESGKKVYVVINSRNAPTVKASIYRVDASDWMRSIDLNRKPKVVGSSIKNWVIDLKSQRNSHQDGRSDAFYSKEALIPISERGLYVLNLTQAGKKAWTVINLSQLTVVTKRSKTKALVWVTNRANGLTVSGAHIAVYNSKGVKVTSGITDREGISLLKLAPDNSRIIVSKGRDYSDVYSYLDPSLDSLNVHFQTDRPVYRPGQTVYYKAILRRRLGQGYQNLPNTKVSVELHDAEDNAIDSIELTSNAMGSVVGQFDIPSEAKIGSNMIVVKLGQEQAQQYFQVEAYRKPEFKVEPVSTAKRWFAGESAAFRINAGYYFGAPLPHGKVNYYISRENNPMGEYSDGDYGSSYYRNENVAKGEVYTDKKGVVVIPFKTVKGATDSIYTLYCTVTDSTKRQVSANSSVPVFASSIRLGISSPISYAPLGSVFPVRVKAVNVDGKAVSTRVMLSLRTVSWNSKHGEWNESPKIVEEAQVTTDSKGLASINLPAKVEGTLIVKASAIDEKGRIAKGSMYFWVAGPGSKSDRPEEDRWIMVKLDKKEYRIGDSVSAFIRSTDRKRPTLITCEGGDVWQYVVIPPGQKTKVWKVKATRQLAPNCYITASQWVRDDLQTIGESAMIANPDWKMNVKVSPDKPEYRPGDKASYTLKTTDIHGKPLTSEMSLSIIDEAIYAIEADQTTDLFQQYWGWRSNEVVQSTSVETERRQRHYPDGLFRGGGRGGLGGGAMAKLESSGDSTARMASKEKVSPSLPMDSSGFSSGIVLPQSAPVVRNRFQDTAYWNPTILTDAEGLAKIDFEVPSDLTTWRATARGLTVNSVAGTGSGLFKSNRSAMLRLALPRQMVVGDTATIIATVDNRSSDEHSFKVSLDVTGIQLDGDSSQTIKVPAKGQAQVEFPLAATDLAKDGFASITGTMLVSDATGEQQADLSDALRLPLRIVPRGVEEHLLNGGVMKWTVQTAFNLPEDTILPASKVRVTVWQGFGAAFRKVAEEILNEPFYGTLDGASHLEAAVAVGRHLNDKDVRECLALLLKNGSYDGWGWWNDSPKDPVVSARVAAALGYARICGMKIYPTLLEAAKWAGADAYKATNLWEFKALLASAGVLIGDANAKARLDQVVAKGEYLSPYARLRMAEAYSLLEDSASAEKLVQSVLENMSDGPTEAFLPSGAGPGWTAGDVETTAQGLVALLRLGTHEDLQSKFARWLALPHSDRWLCQTDNAAIVRALHFYVKKHPESPTLGPVTIEIGGTRITATPAKVGTSAVAEVPAHLLIKGMNTLTISAGTDSEVLYSVDARIYQPSMVENSHGVRILRRYEVQNAAGIWEELLRPVVATEPVRCTVMVWGDDLTDALKVIEPIPAGFEYVDSEYVGFWSNDEVRDGAVVHYLGNAGSPQVFRYFLRAEIDGKLIALPATGDYVRRPSAKGQSNAENIEVKTKK